jgi:hypothetical protein
VVIKRRQIITVLIGALAVCVISHADMMPVSPQDAADSWQSPQASTLTNLQPAVPAAPFSDSSDLPDLDLLPVGSLPEPAADVEQTSEIKPAQILTERQTSLTLCLYALLGLGLCRSVPLVKKFDFGCIPDWYHGDGPSQIGSSFAISPDCLSSVPVFCFIQPDGRQDDSPPRYHFGIVTSLWRMSQSTPAVDAPRGPPSMS